MRHTKACCYCNDLFCLQPALLSCLSLCHDSTCLLGCGFTMRCSNRVSRSPHIRIWFEFLTLLPHLMWERQKSQDDLSRCSLFVPLLSALWNMNNWDLLSIASLQALGTQRHSVTAHTAVASLIKDLHTDSSWHHVKQSEPEQTTLDYNTQRQ